MDGVINSQCYLNYWRRHFLKVRNCQVLTIYETKKRLHELGLHYKKTHACPSNYLLYSKEHAYANECIVCGETRWKSGKGCSFDETNKSSQKKKKKKTYF